MQVDSLRDMARRAATKSYRNITDIGDCPYELIRSVLLRIESPDQLRQLELNSPHVVGKTREIWLNLIKRDVPDWEDKIIYPNNPDNWWKVYRKLRRDMKQENEAGEAMLKAALSGIKNEREENFAKVVTKQPLQGAPRRARSTYNHASGRSGNGRGAAPTNIFDKMRRDAGLRPSNRMATPTHKVIGKNTRITKAPLAMVEEIRAQKRNSPPKKEPVGSPPVRPPRAVLHASRDTKASQRPYDMTVDREERLRKLKAGNASHLKSKSATGAAHTGGPNGLSEDFLEDGDDGGFRDISPVKRQVTPPRVSKNRLPLANAGPMSRPAKRKEPPMFHSPAQRALR